METGASEFDRQRNVLIDQIAQSMEQIISNCNLLTRDIEGIAAVGKEFESVSTLWKSFQEVFRQDETGTRQQQQQQQQEVHGETTME